MSSSIKRTLLGAMLLATTVSSTAVAKSRFPAEEKALNERFAGRTVTAKIDIPIVRSLYVSPDGRWDQDRYYKKMKKHPPGLRAGGTSKLHRVEVKKDMIVVCIDRQCGVSGFTVMGGGRILNKRKTGRIEIEFGRRVTAADLTPETILQAVNRVISIEGEEAPSRFDDSQILSGGSEPGDGVSPMADAVEASVRLLSVEVDPPQPHTGDSVNLIVHAEVSGARLPLTIERQILFAGEPLLAHPKTTTEDFAPGVHRATFELTLPSGASPGVYTFSATVRGGGEEASKDAIFQIQ